MYIPYFLIQLALFVLFVISVYKTFNFVRARAKNWPDLLFNAAVAILSFAFLFH